MARASARHTLVATKEACEALKTKIEAGEDFAKCARENSQCPSGRDGGNLGEFGPGQMVKEFDTVVFSVGATEQHGPHLPLDVDLICPTEIARGAGNRADDRG